MGWVRLDDGFAQHPKVVTLSFEARWAYIEALCYAAKYETDGFVPDVVATNGSVRDALVQQGLWDITDGGVAIHDYLEFNPSRSEREGMRQSKRLAGAIGAATRYGTGGSDSKGEGVVGSGLASKNMEAFELFWAAYPRHVGKRDAAKAFEAAVKRAPVTDIIAGAERLRSDPNLPETRFIPHPATWLRQDRWADDPYPPRHEGKPDRAKKALEKARGRK